MRIFSEKQINYCFYRTIKVGRTYMRPAYPFVIYSGPVKNDKCALVDGYDRGLKSNVVEVRGFVNGFYRVGDPYGKKQDIYIALGDMEQKPYGLLLLAVCLIPFILYNLLTLPFKPGKK